jgi:hypothetical protein
MAAHDHTDGGPAAGNFPRCWSEAVELDQRTDRRELLGDPTVVDRHHEFHHRVGDGTPAGERRSLGHVIDLTPRQRA